MIPDNIQIKNDVLPDQPGVYFYYDRSGILLYIGKATSLRTRVGSYFTKAHGDRIAELVRRIARIEYVITPTVIEALVLEANQIKAHKPPYNILMRDDKSFLYLVVTNEPYPRPFLLRGRELEQMGIDPFRPTLTRAAAKKYLHVFGPYTSSASLKKAMDIIRRAIPWSECQPPSVTGRTRPCFNAHLGKCPGVCTGAINSHAYKKIMRQFVLFFEGKKAQIVRALERQMRRASDALRYEEAAVLRRQIFALQHIQDVAVISREDVELPYARSADVGGISLLGRMEAYDISNISGTFAVGSMVVFEDGKPAKQKYRKFRIKSVQGPNDVGMMEEMIGRRLARFRMYPGAWPLPEVMVIDGGEGQVNRVREVLEREGVEVPVIGIAKGFDRKQDRLVYDHTNRELARVARRGKELFQRARDEAHRFAVSYHRTLRRESSLS